MANPGPNRPFGTFNLYANDRLNRNPPAAQPEQPPTFGLNPFGQVNRANRAAGANPPFVFNPEPRRPGWNLRIDGQWGLNMNLQNRPNRAAVYEADQEYARFQARAFGLPQAPPQDVVAPPQVNGGIPPPPPPPAAPAAPAAPEGGQQPEQNQAADPPVILLGRNGNAGTGHQQDVPPLIAIHNLGRELLGHALTVLAGAAGFISAVVLTVVRVARPLGHFAAQWAVFLIFAALATWASIPTVLRFLVAVHRMIVVLLATLLELLSWALNLSIKWPQGTVVGYTLRPEYLSRAVTGMPFLEPGVCPVGDAIRGPPYGATALSWADLTKFTLPYPLSLSPIRAVWTIVWSLLIAVVSVTLCAMGAALVADLETPPNEDGDEEQ